MPTLSARRVRVRSGFDRAVRHALKSGDRRDRRALEGLIRTVRARSDLLRPPIDGGRIDMAAIRAIVDALASLSAFRKHWVRPTGRWVPRGDNPMPQFDSLTEHLLARYPVPPVLRSSWFRGRDQDARRMQGWYVHLGRGESLRTADLPIRFTKRMAHEFTNSLEHLAIEAAMRRAQVLGMGGNESRASAICDTRLGRELTNDWFWAAAVQYFVNHPGLGVAEMEGIIAYASDQRFRRPEIITGDETTVVLEPEQPDFSFKGRTPESLLRRVDEWCRRPPEDARRLIRWHRSAIGGHRRRRDDGLDWTIVELLDSDAMAAEGLAMHHCVADYTSECARRSTTIWSLGVEGGGERRRLATIEVEPHSRSVYQASMVCNGELDDICRGVIADWARVQALSFD